MSEREIRHAAEKIAALAHAFDMPNPSAAPGLARAVEVIARAGYVRRDDDASIAPPRDAIELACDILEKATPDAGPDVYEAAQSCALRLRAVLDADPGDATGSLLDGDLYLTDGAQWLLRVVRDSADPEHGDGIARKDRIGGSDFKIFGDYVAQLFDALGGIRRVLLKHASPEMRTIVTGRSGR